MTLIFEKEYELLQEVSYPYKGAERKTKHVILKAPTFKQAERFETAERQLNKITALVTFICDSGLIVTKEDGNVPISSALLNDLHIKAIADLLENYNKFFLASESFEEERKF